MRKMFAGLTVAAFIVALGAPLLAATETIKGQIVELQKKNRATWWDKPQDLRIQREGAAATIPQPGYVYFPLPKRAGD